MKVLLVNKFLYPKGGAEVVCLDLARDLQGRGHQTHLFGMADSRNITREDLDCFPRNIDYHASRNLLRKVMESSRTVYCHEARRGMARILDRHRPDIIHMHNIYHQLTPSILQPARERGIPVILTLHDYKLACPVYTFLREGKPCLECLGGSKWPVLKHRCKDGRVADSAVLLIEALLHGAMGSYAKGVTLFTSPSTFLRRKMIEEGIHPERIVHLPNSLPFPTEELNRDFEPPPEAQPPKLLWVGRISSEKGLSTLLRSVKRVKPPLQLQLVGDGPLEGEIAELAATLELGDRIEFLGRRPRHEIPDLIRGAAGTVIPSEWYENAPLALLESLTLGRAVIASRMGGMPDMIKEGETGWLYTAGDGAQLDKCLEQWALSPDERCRRGEQAWRDARERFHPEVILDRTEALYQSLCGKSR